MVQSFNNSDTCSFDGQYEEPYWSQEMFTFNDDSRSSKKARVDSNPLSQFYQSGIGWQQTKCV